MSSLALPFIALILPHNLGAQSEEHIQGWPQPTIILEQLKFIGNERTEVDEIVRLTKLIEGQSLEKKELIAAKKSLLSSGLFESVDLRLSKGSSANQLRITVDVKEKTTWFVVPYFAFSDGSIGGGIAGGETNLFGRSKKIFLGGMWTNSNRSVFAAFRDPSVLESLMILGIDGLFRLEEMTEYRGKAAVRRVDLREGGVTVLPGIQWTPEFSTSIGVFFRHVRQKLRFERQGARSLANGVIENGLDIAGIIRFHFERMTNIEGLEDGIKTEFEVHLSDERFSSTFDYSREIFRLGYYRRFGDRYRWGLRTNLSAQFGQRLPFYRELTAGGSNLRGYRERQFRGDTRYSFGEEVQFSIYRFKHFILRGLGFWDSNILYFRDDGLKRRDWRNGIGVGMRVFLLGVNFPAIGYDFGFGIEEQSVNHYVVIGAQF